MKVFGVETQIEVYRLMSSSILGAVGYVPRGRSPARCCAARSSAAARAAQINTFGGGVVEVLREIVATAGLGMTRAAAE